MNHITPEIVRFCAEECQRQHSGEISVANMVDAYQLACETYGGNTKQIGAWLVLRLGVLVEPEMAKEYRTFPVVVDYVAIPHATISRNIEVLCSLDYAIYDEETAEEFYQFFEKIHPFADGNGRVGAILFNWVNGTLYHPVTPPEFRR